MITASNALKDVLNNDVAIRVSSGCIVEYNWNQMRDLTDASIATSGDYQNTTTGLYPFKKLYPADSVIKPFRPSRAGINYAIDDSMPEKVYSPSSMTYPANYRLYLPGVETYYKYWLSKKDDDNQYLAITYPKDIVVNKIVIKFEISHAIPAGWEIYTTGSGVTDHTSGTKIKDGSATDIPGFDHATKQPGVLSLYYTGSTWTTDESQHSISSSQTIRTLKLKLTNITGHVGVIELSPRFVKDISDSVESFRIVKESSSSEDDAVPVGYVSANSLEMSLTKYNSSEKEMLTYDPGQDSFSTSKIYLYRNIEMRPFIRIYHSGGAKGSSPDKYDDIYQGYFYLENWTEQEQNDISIVAADQAKVLQDTLCPPLLCTKYSITAIFRYLLDSVGFTAYNFNLKKESGTITDKSVISLDYWWTESDMTVWGAIQELCKDTQMTAFIDENNILQFYSREYMYDTSRTSNWSFVYSQEGSQLANIESFDKVDIPTANQVKIFWKGTTSSEYEADSQPLWEAEKTDLVAAGLTADLSTSDLAGSYVSLKPLMTGEEITNTKQALLSFTGYLAIDDEIIEYDAIEYEYLPIGGTEYVPVIITSQSDILKYRGLAEPSSIALRPTQRYRIKTRGAFGTTIAAHSSTYDYESWEVKEVIVS